MIDKIVKVATIVLVIALIGYIAFLKMPKASVSSKEVVAEISAAELYEAFLTDEVSAQETYLGKAVILSGVIDDHYTDESGAPVVILKSEDGDPVALVTLESSEAQKLTGYKVDDIIKVKAQCSGLLMEVTLSKGLIMD